MLIKYKQSQIVKYYFLYEKDNIIGVYILNTVDFNNITFYINYSYRNKSYAKEGLRLMLELIKENQLVTQKELSFVISESNYLAQRVLLSLNAYIHHRDKDKIYLSIRLDGLNLSTIPLVEYDEDRCRFLGKEDFGLEFDAASKLLICYFNYELTSLLKQGKLVEVATVRGCNPIKIYRDTFDKNMYYVFGLVGEPIMAGTLDLFIAHGLTKCFFVGGGGVLVKARRGSLYVISKALRDEGLSFHYLKPSRYVLANEDVLKITERYLQKQNVEYELALTWTIDAIYRETKEKVKLRQAEGVKLVEMEQAGLLAVSEFYNIKYGALIYAGDDLSGNEHDWRNWNEDDLNFKYKMIKYAKDILDLL